MKELEPGRSGGSDRQGRGNQEVRVGPVKCCDQVEEEVGDWWKLEQRRMESEP